MGELFIGLARAAFVGSYFLLLSVGLYGSAAWWSGQAAREMLMARHDHMAAVVLRANPQPAAAWQFAKNPSNLWKRLSHNVFPVLSDPVRQIGKGNIGMGLRDQEMFAWGFIFPILALLLSGLLELLAFPLIRSRLARWLATEDGEQFGRIRELPRGDGFVLAARLRLAGDGGGNPHILTVGPSGTGKTSSQVIPSLLSLPDDCSVIVTDPKAELFSRCATWLDARKHKVVLLSPSIGFGVGWCPLSECRSADEVRNLARMILGSMNEGKTDEWQSMSLPLLSAYLVEAWAAKKSLVRGLQSLFADAASGEALTDRRAKSDFALFEVGRGASATSGSILMTIQGAVSPWLSEQVAGWIECPRRFRFEDIREKRVAVFLATSASNMKATAAIQNVFFSMLFARLAEGRGGRVRILFDEFANLGHLEGVDQALNLLRSAGVAIHAHIQNLAQLRAVYGPAAGDVVAESFGTVCVMAGLRNDAEQLAKMLGLKAKVRASYSTQDEKMRAQFSQNEQQEQGSMIRQLKKNQTLVISGHHRPVIARLRPWFRVRRLRKRVMPKVMRKDWGQVPEQAVQDLMQQLGKVEPVEIDTTPVKPSESTDGGKMKKRKRRQQHAER